ncbi:MAG: signal peptide peptidase SppA [Deltaproteobacteria bacterium]
MSGKGHPIIAVLLIIVAVGLVLGLALTFFYSVAGPSEAFSFKEKIGVLPIDGTITESDALVAQLVELRKDRRIKAIVLRVNSPGGSVGPSQEIYREIRKTVETKKVVASLGGLAASGGYYAASAADKIVANPGTLAGSIGVIMEFVQVEELLKKVGVNVEVLKTGEFKDIGSPHRKLSERDREMIRTLVFDVQRQFVEAVAQGRNLPVEKVREIADGRVLSGAQCKELGLVDQLGNFEDAVDLAKTLAGIRGEVTLVYPKKPRERWWTLFLQDMSRAVYGAVRDAMTVRLEYRWEGIP